MQITITGRHVEITPALRDHAMQRLKKISCYSFEPMEATVRLAVEKYRHRAEIVLWVNGDRILAKEETDGMYRSIDLAMEKIEQRLRKYKEKLSRHKLSSNRRIISPKPSEPAPVKTGKPYIVPTFSTADAVSRLTVREIDPLIFFDDADEKLKVLKFGKNGRLEMTELIIE